MRGAARGLRYILTALAVIAAAGDGAAQPAPSTTPQAASADGTAFARQARSEAAAIPDKPVNASNIPGYQPPAPHTAGLFGSSDAALSSEAGAYTQGEGWTTMRSADANRSRIDPAFLQDLLNRAQDINDNAASASLEIGAGGARGHCQAISQAPAQVYYDATCDVGETLTSVAPVTQYACPAGWTLAGTACSYTQNRPADVTYSCPDGTVRQGSDCIQVRPASIAGYTCPAGYTLNAPNCARTLTQAATLAGYTCPPGYQLESSSCRRALEQPATPIQSCPEGWELTGAACTARAVYPASVQYSCPAGWDLAGTVCNRTLSQLATPTYTCQAGFTLAGSVCLRSGSYAAAVNYACPAGFALSGSVCFQTVTQTAEAAYSCAAGWAYNGVQCTRSVTSYTYTCFQQWELAGTYLINTCPVLIAAGCSLGSAPAPSAYAPYKGLMLYRTNVPAACETRLPASPALRSAIYKGVQTYYYDYIYKTAVTETRFAPPTLTYSCPDGFTLSGSVCAATTERGAEASYTCPDGGTLTGSVCATVTTMAADIGYLCPEGFVPTASACVQTQSQPAAAAYSCPNGGILAGTDCTAVQSQPAAVRYACPAGWTLSGSQCSRAEVLAASPAYTCPPGYDLAETLCRQTEVQPAAVQYSCPADHALNGSLCTSTQPAVIRYTCPADFALAGTICSQTLTQPASGVLACAQANAALEGGKCIEAATKSDCSLLAANPQCSFVRDTCLDEAPSGPCRVMEKTFRCPVPGEQGPASPAYVCSGELYCAGGSCQQIEREASGELKDALVALGAIGQANKEFDPATMGLFEGARETCHQPIFGLVNCCAGKVSGLLTGGSAALAWSALGSGGLTAIAGIATQFLTVFMCSSAEKQLDVKDRLGLCHFVGSYCSASFLGVCTSKKKAYCCYESKLTRILQEQGRPQLNKPWGKPKEETCLGFTIEEFSRLDLSQMDFSEIYSEFLEAAKLPDEAQMASDIQDKIRAYYQQHGAQ